MTGKTARQVASMLVMAASMFGAVPAAAQTGPSAVVRARNAEFMAAVKSQQAAAVAAIYAADGEFTESGDRARMRDGVQKRFETFFSQGMATLELQTSDADFANGVITESGAYVVKRKGGAVMAQGSYVTTWTREGGVWKIRKFAATPAGGAAAPKR